ncbi:electron transport complex subunit RsxC [Eubacteriaceae bacterium ES2]|nr:electron transport complex subunit RsxC [Eubacteriaceae bacterium ES2]
MEDYTKFKLKRKGELEALLADKNDLFVMACSKCYKELQSFDEPECGQFLELAKEQGKNITGSVQVDFLCNEPLTKQTFESALPADTKNIVVISCGLGIQTIAAMADVPVYAGSDTLVVDGQHGMALTDTLCEACGQCYLNLTGGICPIVDCSKSLLNGQCGGAKNGKCEVNKDMDCGWQLIYERLEKQGRLEEWLNQPVEVRDYSKVNHKFVSEYVQSVRESRYDGYYGGIHPTEHKELSEHLGLKAFPAPLNVVIPMSQHAGAPAEPVVAVGDQVKMGQLIAKASGLISSNIHASVSGTVVAVEPRRHTVSGLDSLAIVIQSDGKDTLDDSIKPAGDLDNLSADEIIELVRDKGIVGMGGAGFPTAVKLKAPKPIELVLLNGCECEPVLTADHRVLLEYADDVVYGLQAMMKASGAPKGVIAIEDNKSDAVELLQEKTAGIDNIEVVVAKTKYPQGAEKMLIKRVMGKSVPSGGLPMDVGAVVSNVSTAKAISDAIKTGMPLIERVVTVSGEKMTEPQNFLMKIGTSVKEIVNQCGGVKGDDTTIKIGGPMMGFEVADLNVPVLKCSNGVIAVETKVKEAVECIKCGRCADVCPMELRPLYFTKYAGAEDWEGFKAQNVMDCIECGCCEYICSSKIPIVERIKIGKTAIREGK